MGIYLMKNNVDELKYRAIEPGGNELTLVKKIE
jgi:anti-sigma regulatory factor (Ser/Thr protein kinase)